MLMNNMLAELLPGGAVPEEINLALLMRHPL